MVLCLLAVAPDALALRLDVKVEGLKDQQEANVLALLAIHQERKDPDLDANRILALHRVAPDQIRDALAPFGLYRVEVVDSLTEPPAPDGTWVASYRVDPGPAIKIRSVDYRVTGPGAENPAFPKTFPMKAGDVLLHADYEKAKTDLRYAAASQGYLDFQLVRHQVLIDPVAYEALIEVHLDTGPQYYLGEVRFKQDLLDEGLLERYVGFQPGSLYDPDELVGLQARLLGTEYFDKVEVIPLKEEGGEGLTVPVEVVAHRNKANKYRVGVGYATDTGPRLSLDWRRRYWNRWGHQSRTQLTLSPVLSGWELDYRIPIRDPLRDYVSIKPQVTYYSSTSREGWIGAVQGAYSIVTANGWRRTLGLDYRYEDYTINEVETKAANELSPYINWSRTVTDDPVFTKRGYRLKFGVLGASDVLISPATYLSANFDVKWIHAFWKDYRFIARSELGATWADSVDDLPASRRFYAGGDNSIRGWGFDALGPNDPETELAVGGRYLAVGSLELERRIKGPWSAAVFTDFGNAFDPDYAQEYKQSVGLGVRWLSPIGQIRVDLAFALTKDDWWEEREGLPPTRLHFVIGPDL
jgi:translocation and assembly module TamA